MMESVLLCLCLNLPLGGSAPESWLAEDKWKHFFASFAVTTISASGARTIGLDAGDSAAFGAAVGAGAGLWKEFRDARQPQGRFSFADLVWDLGGIGAGTAVMSQAR